MEGAPGAVALLVARKPDAGELAELALRLLLDSPGRRAMGEEARRLAEQEFSAHRQVVKLLALYENTLRRV